MIVLVDNGSPVAVGNEETKFIYNLLPVGRFMTSVTAKLISVPKKLKKWLIISENSRLMKFL